MSREARIEKLKAMLKARKDEPNFADNVAAIKAAIAEHEARLS